MILMANVVILKQREILFHHSHREELNILLKLYVKNNVEKLVRDCKNCCWGRP
jgi:hypothetical protein